jgi:hypothetical protein
MSKLITISSASEIIIEDCIEINGELKTVTLPAGKYTVNKEVFEQVKEKTINITKIT